MKRFLLLFTLLFPASGYAVCVPSLAKPGMIGCEPVAASVLGTDYVQMWAPALFPASATIISVNNLLTGRTIVNPVITGGSINNTPIGATTPSTGAFTTLSATGDLTVAGKATIRDGTITKNGTVTTWSGSLLIPPNTGFTSYGSWTGTTSLGGDVPLHYISVTSDNMQAATAASVSTFATNHNVVAGAIGDRVGGYFRLFQNETTSNTNGQYIAETAWAGSNANDNGSAQTQTGVAGGLWGRTTLAIASSASTYFRGVTGHEIDVSSEMVQGAAPLTRIGNLVVNGINNISQGLAVDSAYVVSSAAPRPTGRTWKKGFVVGVANSSNPIDANGVGFGVDASQDNSTFGYTPANNTMGWLLDGIDGRYNGGLIRGPGFKVGPSGQILNGPLSISYSGATSTIDVSQFVGPAVGVTFSGGTLTSGGTNIVAGSRLTDAYGGTYYVDAVSAGVATLITVYAQASDSSTHTGAVTLTPDGQAVTFGAGGTITVTQTWTAGTTINFGNTTATGINIGGAATGAGLLLGGASAKVGFYAATPVVKQTGVAVTAAGVHAALVNLGLIAP